MSEGSERGRQRLGQFVVARRKELGLSVREAARRAGVMRPTWTGLEQGSRRTADYNFAAMERTLSWRPGSIEAVLQGGAPPAIDDDGPSRPESHPGAITNSDDVAAGVDPDEVSVVPWSALVRVLDEQLGAIGQAATAGPQGGSAQSGPAGQSGGIGHAGGGGGTHRLWGAELLTGLARRLRPSQRMVRDVLVVPWSEVVNALETAIAGIHQDVTMSSEARLWGIEIVVDVAAELKAAREPMDDDAHRDS